MHWLDAEKSVKNTDTFFARFGWFLTIITVEIVKPRLIFFYFQEVTSPLTNMKKV